MKRIGLLSAFFFFLIAATAAIADGQINAVSFQPLPQGSSLFVRPLDNSDHNLVLQKDFARVLRQKGHTVSREPALILTFETRDPPDSGPTAEPIHSR